MTELLLNAAAPSTSAIKAHLASCASCKDEYSSLRATLALMDEWKAPEPSPYFDQKLAVRIREEQAAPQLNFFQRLRDRILFNTGAQFRPVLSGALALVLIAGGGTFAGLNYHAQPSATVKDLQILDKNEQALQQMDQLLQDDDNNPTDNAPAQPTS